MTQASGRYFNSIAKQGIELLTTKSRTLAQCRCAPQNQGCASYQKPAGLLFGPNSAWFGSKLSTTRPSKRP